MRRFFNYARLLIKNPVERNLLYGSIMFSIITQVVTKKGFSDRKTGAVITGVLCATFLLTQDWALAALAALLTLEQLIVFLMASIIRIICSGDYVIETKRLDGGGRYVPVFRRIR